MTNTVLSILIVEDEMSVSGLMQAVLDQSYDCTVVARFGEALRHLRDRKFDLVLADDGLPDGSGLYLLALALPATSVVITSGKTDAESVQSALSKGACAYLRKPFNLADLRSAVEMALKQRADRAA
jgi:DNA-binding response OmpR family regulator